MTEAETHTVILAYAEVTAGRRSPSPKPSTMPTDKGAIRSHPTLPTQAIKGPDDQGTPAPQPEAEATGAEAAADTRGE